MYVGEIVGEVDGLDLVVWSGLLRLPLPTLARQIVSPTLRREIDRQLARVVLERDDVLEVVEDERGVKCPFYALGLGLFVLGEENRSSGGKDDLTCNNG